MISSFKRLPKCSNITTFYKFWFSLNEQKVEYYKAVLASSVVDLIMKTPKAGTQSKDGSYPSLRSLCIDTIKNYNPGAKIQPAQQISEKNSEENCAAGIQSIQQKSEKIPEEEKCATDTQSTQQKSDKILEEQNFKAEVEEAKNFMLAYFIGGVWIHQMYCSQKRFGTNPVLKSEIESSGEPIQDYLNLSENEQFKKIVFCPTHMITTQIFTQFKDSEQILLLYGQPGIGKSFSFLLYRSLSEIIFRYKHKYARKCVGKSEINFKIPKMVYFSLPTKEQQDYSEEQIYKTISSQCFQTFESFSEKEFTEDFKNRVRKSILFHKQIGNQTKMVIDQINLQPSLLVQIEEHQKKMKKIQAQIDKLGDSQADQIEKTELKSQYNKQRSKKWRKQQTFYKYYVWVQRLRASFGKVIYLSSMDIEFHLLQKINLNGDSSHQRNIPRTHIDYENFLENPSMVSDHLELITTIFEATVISLKRYLPNMNKNDLNKLSEDETDSLNLIKHELKELFKNKYVPLTLLSIRQALDEKKEKFLKKIEMQNLISKLENKTNLVEFVISRYGYLDAGEFVDTIGNQIFQKNCDFLRKKIYEFLEKEKQPSAIKEKSQLLLNLLYKAKDELDQRQNNPSLAKNPFYLKLNEDEVKVAQKFDQHLTRKLFQYDKKQKLYILSVHPQTLANILAGLERKLVNAVVGNPDDVLKLFQDGSPKGQNLQFVMKQIMAQKYSVFQYSSSLTGSKTFIFQDKPRAFEAIPTISDKKYPTYDFYKIFYKLIEQSMKSQGRASYFHKPVRIEMKMNKQEQIDCPQSKEIDFVVCQRKNKQIQIYVYDVTVSKDSDQAKKKVLQFLFDYSNFKDNAFRYWKGPKISYQPNIYYNVIVAQKFKINWELIIENKRDKLNNQLEAKKQSISKQRWSKFKKLLNGQEIMKKDSLQECERDDFEEIRQIWNAYQLFKNIKITKIKDSNSFSIDGITNNQKSSSSVLTSELKQVTLKGVEIICLDENFYMKNPTTRSTQIQKRLQQFEVYKKHYKQITKKESEANLIEKKES